MPGEFEPHSGCRPVDWHFNAWGGLSGRLYFPWDRDDRAAAKVLEVEGADRYRAPIVLEGGSIHVDGQGTLIATEEFLLNRNRNPELTLEEIERTLGDIPRHRDPVALGALPGKQSRIHEALHLRHLHVELNVGAEGVAAAGPAALQGIVLADLAEDDGGARIRGIPAGLQAGVGAAHQDGGGSLALDDGRGA
jgi:hypothetical protein